MEQTLRKIEEKRNSLLTYTMSAELKNEFGWLGASIIHNFQYWQKQNIENKKNFHDGKTWVFTTIRKLAEKYSESWFVVWRKINQLKKYGILETGNYNHSPWNRTTWYTIISPYVMDFYEIPYQKSELKIFDQKGKNRPETRDTMHSASMQNGLCADAESLNILKQNIKKDIQTLELEASQEKGFVCSDLKIKNEKIPVQVTPEIKKNISSEPEKISSVIKTQMEIILKKEAPEPIKIATSTHEKETPEPEQNLHLIDTKQVNELVSVARVKNFSLRQLILKNILIHSFQLIKKNLELSNKKVKFDWGYASYASKAIDGDYARQAREKEELKNKERLVRAGKIENARKEEVQIKQKNEAFVIQKQQENQSLEEFFNGIPEYRLVYYREKFLAQTNAFMRDFIQEVGWTSDYVMSSLREFIDKCSEKETQGALSETIETIFF